MASSPSPVANDFDALDTAKGLSLVEMIGQVLKVVAGILDAPRVARLGGPGQYRRLQSIDLLFMILAIVGFIRQRAIIMHSVIVDVAIRTLRFLSHPPSRWAGA